MSEMKKILFPCDLTENSLKCIPYVISVSEKYNSTIYLLHVVQDPPLWKKAIEDAKESVDKVCQQFKSCANFQRKTIPGDPALEILKTIESEDIDLVIMGTHGRKGLEHAIFGSVAEHVVQESPIPMLIINPHKLK